MDVLSRMFQGPRLVPPRRTSDARTTAVDRIACDKTWQIGSPFSAIAGHDLPGRCNPAPDREKGFIGKTVEEERTVYEMALRRRKVQVAR